MEVAGQVIDGTELLSRKNRQNRPTRRYLPQKIHKAIASKLAVRLAHGEPTSMACFREATIEDAPKICNICNTMLQIRRSRFRQS